MRDKPRLVVGNGVRVMASGRRIWPADVKAGVVAESHLPRARVCEVAKRHGLASAQLTAWPRAPIEIEASGVVVRLAHDAPSAQIAEVASALRRVK